MQKADELISFQVYRLDLFVSLFGNICWFNVCGAKYYTTPSYLNFKDGDIRTEYYTDLYDVFERLKGILLQMETEDFNFLLSYIRQTFKGMYGLKK